MARSVLTEGQRPDDAVIAWKPQEGPQTALLGLPDDINECFFGGARGGGKTDGMLGEWGQHAALYGKHALGVFFRKTSTQLDETWERAKEIFNSMGAVSREQKKTIIMPGGGRLKFRHLERDADAELYQGHSYCVGVGTQIRMGDGSFNPIEKITVGEYVSTLIGPRKVLLTVKPYLADCAKALALDAGGAVLGEQIHPAWHPVLTTAGLTSSRKPEKPQSAGRPQHVRRALYKQDGESLTEHHQDTQPWHAWLTDEGTDCKSSLRLYPKLWRLEQLSVPVVLHEPRHRLNEQLARDDHKQSTRSCFQYKYAGLLSGLYRGLIRSYYDLAQLVERARLALGLYDRDHPNGFSCAQSCYPRATDSQGRYPCGYGFCGEPLLTCSETDRGRIPLSSDAGNTRHALPLDESGTTQEHSHSEPQSWVHPYTGEAFDLSEDVSRGTMELSWYGPHMVADLCVEEANHYISDCGLINKNTRNYVEEITNWGDPKPINKLRATLRSAHGVPCKFMATGNPGGPGHQWVKARYIDPDPRGYKFITDHMTVTAPNDKGVMEKMDIDFTRVFIPSKLQDNKLMFIKDPSYVANLKQSGSEQLVRAWLDGDWDVIDGAYFDEWRGARHVIAPFTPPKHLEKFVSFDWGSAKPFSAGLWVVMDGTYKHPMLPFYFPRGALVRINEWYGADVDASGNRVPNKGLKMYAEQVGAGLWSRYATPNVVADPAVFTEDGGESIAEKMSKASGYKLIFRRADNKRITGWDQMRGRLKGNDDGIPMIYVVSTCLDSIRTIPSLQHDERNPEDLDTNSEDHAADEWRYACTSRPFVKLAEPTTPPINSIQDMSINELWADRNRHKGRRQRI